MATVTLKGNPVHTNGALPAVGSKAPDFLLVNGDLADVTLATYAGKRKIISIVASLETSTCSSSARRFNAEAGSLKDTVVLIVSADLPFASKRFCEVEGLQNVVALSLMRSRKFAKDYGVLLQDGPFAGITARAVLVLDAQDRVIYTQLVPEISHEPDYDRALAALR